MGTGEFLGNLTNRGRTCDGLASRQRGVEILLAASCYGNRDKLWPDEPAWLQGFTFFNVNQLQHKPALFSTSQPALGQRQEPITGFLSAVNFKKTHDWYGHVILVSRCPILAGVN